jgi:hypothetical protein
MNVREAAKVRNRLSTWYVESETTPGTEYIVHNKRSEVSHRKTWTCNCLDFTERQFYRGGICKHIQAVQNFRNLQIAKAEAEKALSTPAATPVLLSVKDIIATLMTGFKQPEGLSLWNLVSFLRGPDTVGSWKLKSKTTAVLRAKLGMAKGLVDTNFMDEPFGIELVRKYFGLNDGRKYEFQSRLSEELRSEFPQVVTEHFANHYSEALMTAYKLGYIK